MTVTIPHFSIRIQDNGEMECDPITLHVHFDVCPSWVQLAKQHLGAALVARSRREEAWAGTDEAAKAQALEAEFEASMQAIMAAAIAWDAAYSVLYQHANVPPALAESWRTSRTGRYSQVAEVVRRSFVLKPKGAAILRTNLKEIYRYRDLAVHPSGKIEAPLLHPELNLGVEWRFVYFRASNAELAVSTAVGMLWDLAHNGKARHPKVMEYQKVLAARLQEIFPSGEPLFPSVAVGK